MRRDQTWAFVSSEHAHPAESAPDPALEDSAPEERWARRSVTGAATSAPCSTCEALDDGNRLYDVADGFMRKLQNLVGDDPNTVTNLRFSTLRELIPD